MVSRTAAVGGATATACASSGGGLVTLATIALIVLKLVGVIHLAWWFCLFGPFLIALGIGIGGILVVAIFFGLGAGFYFALIRPFVRRHQRKSREQFQSILAARRAGKPLPNKTRW